MTVRYITVLIQGGRKELRLAEPFLTKRGSTIKLNDADVYFNFKNVTSNNNIFTVNSIEKTLEEGYWDFRLLKERLKGEHIILTPNIHDNTCNIEVESKASGDVNLLEFGTLLGFGKDHLLKKGTKTKSPNSVDVNRGLKYLEVTCDLIDPTGNVSTDGNGSRVLATLPVVEGVRLTSSVVKYRDSCSSVPVKSDIVTEMVFTVKPNVDVDVDVEVLLNLVVESVYK